MSSMNDFVPFLEVTRGRIVESIHFGALAVTDSTGKLVASCGNPDTVTFLRSSAKPFQALPFVERGGVEAFGLTEKELALICSSHSGTDEHLEVVRGIQAKVGIEEDQLRCGTHPVSDEPTAEAMLLRGEEPSINRHNCSGKHTGMLAHAKLRGLPLEDYIELSHPVQQTILQTFAEMCGMEPSQVEVGVDGCSVPTFAVPLQRAAWAMAKVCDPSTLSETRATACRKITHAMTTNPRMVAGLGRFDTALMEVADGMVLCKGGAEGYQIMGLMPGALGADSPAMGIAFKISDGDLGGHVRPTFPGISSDSRVRPIIALSILKHLGALSAEQAHLLAEFDARPIRNWQQIEIGEYRSALRF
jgi:L-asparaginase II